MTLPIHITNLEITRGHRVIFSGLSLDIHKGDRIAITGASGVGKSSLLMAIAGLIKPTLGQILVGDRPVTAARSNVTMMQQRSALLPWADVRSNIALGLQFSGLARKDKTQTSAIVDDLLERIGLADRGDALPADLSGGQQQRVALARALAPHPDVLLLDEPFSSLDQNSRVRLREDVARLTDEAGVTVVLVTHDIADADALCPRRFELTSALKAMPSVRPQIRMASTA